MTRPVRVVLDTTAIVAYAHGSDHVGEVLREIADEHAAAAVPVVCLAEASAQADTARLPLLNVLAASPHVIVVPLTGDWRALGLGCRLYGTVGRAVAMSVAAGQPAAYLLTADPGGYGDDQGIVIGI